jgi:hypothetical protein
MNGNCCSIFSRLVWCGFWAVLVLMALTSHFCIGCFFDIVCMRVTACSVVKLSVSSEGKGINSWAIATLAESYSYISYITYPPTTTTNLLDYDSSVLVCIRSHDGCRPVSISMAAVDVVLYHLVMAFIASLWILSSLHAWVDVAILFPSIGLCQMTAA